MRKWRGCAYLPGLTLGQSLLKRSRPASWQNSCRFDAVQQHQRTAIKFLRENSSRKTLFLLRIPLLIQFAVCWWKRPERATTAISTVEISISAARPANDYLRTTHRNTWCSTTGEKNGNGFSSCLWYDKGTVSAGITAIPKGRDYYFCCPCL